MRLRLDFVDYVTARRAVVNYHYSKHLPAGKMVRIGVFEDGTFKGVVIFSRGANANMLKEYQLSSIEGCELARVALKDHTAPVSQIVSIAVKMLKKACPGLRIIISYADDRQGHVGGIYQAGNWVYTGRVSSTPEYFVNGRWMHNRTVSSLFGCRANIPAGTQQRPGGYRYKYLFPLDTGMAAQIEKLRKPYPKKCVDSLKVKQLATSGKKAGQYRPSRSKKEKKNGVL